MKDLLKGVVAICAIALICVTALNHGMNSDITKYGILIIGGIAIGADAVTSWVEKRRNEPE